MDMDMDMAMERNVDEDRDGPQHPCDWRKKATQLAFQLERAHSAMEDLGAALDEGDEESARLNARSAHEAVGSVGYAVKTLHTQLPPRELLDEPDAIGSTLAIGGSGVATIALDVMVTAMLALAATDDGDVTDFLIGACLDAENAYEMSAAVVQDAPRRDPPAMFDLQRAFDTDGSVALRQRVITTRSRVREINERIRRERLAS
jgi:hypothetical protein